MGSCSKLGISLGLPEQGRTHRTGSLLLCRPLHPEAQAIGNGFYYWGEI